MPRASVVPAVLFMVFSITAHADDIAGNWSGTWTKYGDQLPVAVTFAKAGAGYSGFFDSDALQVAGIPFAEVSESGSHVHFVLKGDQSATDFEAEQHGDEIDGTLTENGVNGTFRIART